MLCNEVVSIVVQGSPTDAGASSDSSGNLVLQQSFHFVGQVSCMLNYAYLCTYCCSIWCTSVSLCTVYNSDQTECYKIFPWGAGKGAINSINTNLYYLTITICEQIKRPRFLL